MNTRTCRNEIVSTLSMGWLGENFITPREVAAAISKRLSGCLFPVFGCCCSKPINDPTSNMLLETVRSTNPAMLSAELLLHRYEKSPANNVVAGGEPVIAGYFSWQKARLITWMSPVRVRPPQPFKPLTDRANSLLPVLFKPWASAQLHAAGKPHVPGGFFVST